MARKNQSAPDGDKRARGRPDMGTAEPLNHEQERIYNWLKKVRFRKVLFGGVNEVDLWRKLAELNSMYEAALSAERARYDALIKERCSLADNGKAGDETNE